MSLSMYGRAQRTCRRACPHAQTNTYTRIYTHTYWNTHTTHSHTRAHYFFLLCQFDTLFESRVFYWKRIVGILWIYLFICLLLWDPKIYDPPPGMKSQGLLNFRWTSNLERTSNLGRTLRKFWVLGGGPDQLNRCGPIAICEEGHCSGRMQWDPVM